MASEDRDDLNEFEEEGDGEDEEEFDEPPYQAIVLFREFPDLDTAALQQSMNSLEPSEDECEVSDFVVGTLESSSHAAEFLSPECVGKRTAAGVITWSDLQLAVILHEWPAPTESLAFAAAAGGSLPAVREALQAHQAYALLNVMDTGTELHPVERIILLLKAGIAMAEQGAIAMANEHNSTFFPGDLLVQLGQAARESLETEDTEDDALAAAGPGGNGQAEHEDKEEFDEEEPLSLWDSLRSEGMPPELLVSLLPVEDEQGQLWFVTRGHAQCELPELAYKAQDLSEYEEIDGHFKNAFSYMMENGPVLEPGHTLGYDENALMRFAEPDVDEEFLESPYGTLVVTLENHPA